MAKPLWGLFRLQKTLERDQKAFDLLQRVKMETKLLYSWIHWRFIVARVFACVWQSFIG